jgi:pyridoxamine 5'-phosphate oxidase-like protein
MASWADFAAAEPELAARVEERFGIRKHKTLATIRKDGSPRISGIEIQFDDGQVVLGMMPDSRKLADLRRDPRVAIHSPTDDPPVERPAAWKGEAKISGRATLPEASSPTGEGPSIQIDIAEVVFTHLNEQGDRLVIESWHPGGGKQRLERT